MITYILLTKLCFRFYILKYITGTPGYMYLLNVWNHFAAPISEPVVEQPPIPQLPINVNAIYEKLIAAGILPKKTEEPKSSETEPADKDSKPTEEEEEEEIKVPHIRLTPKCLRE